MRAKIVDYLVIYFPRLPTYQENIIRLATVGINLIIIITLINTHYVLHFRTKLSQIFV